MKDFVKTNQQILDEWEKSNNDNYQETNFSPDGIMYRGAIETFATYSERFESLDDAENRSWEEAKMRILFITKDQNANGDDAWDVRGETGKLTYAFFRNLMYQLYGLVNTKTDHKADYNFTNENAIELYNTFPIARINVKKEAGNSSINNNTLRYYLNREPDVQFLKRQIENLDADIIVCCGYSDSIEDSGNLILNFLNNHCCYHFEQFNNWMWYDKDTHKLAINNWHLSVRNSSEKIYHEMIQAYYEFLNAYPEFSNIRK